MPSNETLVSVMHSSNEQNFMVSFASESFCTTQCYAYMCVPDRNKQRVQLRVEKKNDMDLLTSMTLFVYLETYSYFVFLDGIRSRRI